MMKYTLITLLLGLAYLAPAQTRSEKVQITYGKEHNEKPRTTVSDIVGYDPSGMYVVRKKPVMLKYKYYLEHYDLEMNKTKEAEVNLENKLNWEYIVSINQNLYILSSLKQKNIKKHSFFVQNIDKKNLQPQAGSKQIGEIDYNGFKNFNAGSFWYEISKNRSKILIAYNQPYERKGKEKFGFRVFDNNFKELWHKQIELPYSDELFSVMSYTVDNSGNTYIVGKLYDEKKEARKARKEGRPSFVYKILKYSNNGTEFKEYPITIEDHFITDMQISIDTDENIVCSGFYSKEGTYSIGGSYFLRIDGKTQAITTKGFEPFEENFIVQHMTERQAKKAKKKADRKKKGLELYEYDLDEIILKKDGGAVLVGEQYYMYITTTTDSEGRTSSTYHYIYNDIIVVNMDKEGQTLWKIRIPKKQHSVNDGGIASSYVLSKVGNKLMFIFNDDIENMTYTEGDKIKNFSKNKKKSATVLVEVGNQGKQSKEILFTVEDVQSFTLPKVSEQISKDEVMLFGQYKRKNRFFRVKFK